MAYSGSVHGAGAIFVPTILPPPSAEQVTLSVIVKVTKVFWALVDSHVQYANVEPIKNIINDNVNNTIVIFL